MNKYRLALIGSNIVNSLSPHLMQFFASRTSVLLDYSLCSLPCDCTDKQLLDAITAYDGVNITMPFKFRVADLLCIDGAVNTVVCNGGISAYACDGIGVASCLFYNGIDVRGKDLLIVGAGGAAYSASQVLADLGANLYYVNRTHSRAQRLADSFGGYALEWDISKGIYDTNASVAVSHFDGILSFLPIKSTLYGVNEQYIKQADFVFDCLYGTDTVLLDTAKHANVRAINGLGMLYFQGAESFELFTRVAVKNVEQIYEEFLYEITNR